VCVLATDIVLLLVSSSFLVFGLTYCIIISIIIIIVIIINRSTFLSFGLDSFSISYPIHGVGRTLCEVNLHFSRPLLTHSTAQHSTAQHKQNKRTQTSMSQVGFEQTISVLERSKTTPYQYYLDLQFTPKRPSRDAYGANRQQQTIAKTPAK
jgi:hypothetical protein